MLLKKCDSCWSKVLQRPLEATLDFFKALNDLKKKKIDKKLKQKSASF